MAIATEQFTQCVFNIQRKVAHTIKSNSNEASGNWIAIRLMLGGYFATLQLPGHAVGGDPAAPTNCRGGWTEGGRPPREVSGISCV